MKHFSYLQIMKQIIKIIIVARVNVISAKLKKNANSTNSSIIIIVMVYNYRMH